MGLILSGVSANDLILDGSSVSLYVGGTPPVKVWPTGPMPVRITLGTDMEARDQLRAALTDRGLSHTTVTEIPFDIELIGTGSARDMFGGCAALTRVPDMDTSQVTDTNSMFWGCAALTYVPDMDTGRVTNMRSMFQGCSALVSVPDMDTSQATNMYGMFRDCLALTYVPDMDTHRVTSTSYMFDRCAALTDGNVRLIGKHPSVNTNNMIRNSGLKRLPFYNSSGNPI